MPSTKDVIEEFAAAYEKVQNSNCDEPTMVNLATANKQGALPTGWCC